MNPKKKIIIINIIIICTIGLVICMFHQVISNRNSIRLEAHRGFSDIYPENTIVAFEAAGQSDLFDAIETDVQMTSDGVLVLMHDSKLDRTTNGTGSVNDYTFNELLQFKIDGGNNVAEYPNEKIPTLEEFLKICKKFNKIPYLEMKRTLPKEGVEKLIKTLEEYNQEDKCVLTTFSIEHVKYLRDITDKYEVQLMISNESDINLALDTCLQYPNTSFRPNAYFLDEEIANLFKKNKIQIEAFGLDVGDDVTFRKLSRLGIRGVTCNSYVGIR